jgi:hypothetical protein
MISIPIPAHANRNVVCWRFAYRRLGRTLRNRVREIAEAEVSNLPVDTRLSLTIPDLP